MKKKRSLIKSAWEIFKSIIFSVIISSIIVFSMAFLLEYTAGQIAIQTVCMLIFLYMIYASGWYDGDRDKNFVQFGRIQEDYLWGLKSGLIAMIPPMCTSLLLVFSKLGWTFDMTIFYKLLNPHLNVLIRLLIPTADVQNTGWLAILGVTLYQLLIPAASTCGYILGYKRLSLSEKLIYKNKPRNAKAEDRRRR